MRLRARFLPCRVKGHDASNYAAASTELLPPVRPPSLGKNPDRHALPKKKHSLLRFAFPHPELLISLSKPFLVHAIVLSEWPNESLFLLCTSHCLPLRHVTSYPRVLHDRGTKAVEEAYIVALLS
ncbi:hypothetical protein E2C01_071478 [Portunus trituberculatus]|uniref:Uncharacterized protein n=1 Tax=Portunus trituberculatus TaxID=210409 RepID=A0A5B7I584_PORTR|nr:hypothetical protein [Portunus trituberculatus]